MTAALDAYPLTAYWDAIVLPVVKQAARRYEGHTTQEDIGQDAAEWWYGPGRRYLPEYLSGEDPTYLRLRRSIYRWVTRKAEAEKAQRAGYHPEDQVSYRPAEVASLLPLALDPHGIPDGGGVADETGIKAHGNKAEGGNVLASLLDVRSGLRQLNDDDHAFVTLAVDRRQDWDQVAEITGTQPDSCRRRFARISERIARSLSNEMEDAA